MLIYKTTNLIDRKIYIGKYEGTRESYLGSGIYLKRAILKYGIENFKRENIDTASSRDELNNKEKYWISFYNSRDPNIGYNISKGGDGFNSKHSEESKAKIGSFHRGKTRSEEDRRKISDGRKGMKFSDDHRRNMSESKRGKMIGKNNPFYGKRHSEESKLKMSKSLQGREGCMKGKKHTEESKIKMSISRKGKESHMKGRKLSLETRNKISESQIGRIPWNKGKNISEEQKRKISETLKNKRVEYVCSQ
jgi:hypothetical protein